MFAYDSAQQYSKHELNFSYCESINNHHHFVKMFGDTGLASLAGWWVKAVRDEP
jgi:hypothetical protein